MLHNYDRCLKFVLQYEGSKYTDDPVDPGGATRYGITFNTLKAWRKTDITKNDVKNLTLEEAKKIYKANYWDTVKGDVQPEPLELLLFDFAVNAGVSRSIKFAQEVVGFKGDEVDGKIGPKTTKAFKEYDVTKFINDFHTRKMDHYRSLSTWWRFKNGWTNRANDVKVLAKLLLVTPDPTPIVESDVPVNPVEITPRVDTPNFIIASPNER